ncbi:hypothetical protein PMAYCL1PPCAC_16467, partial [Pristionchus mayeri]
KNAQIPVAGVALNIVLLYAIRRFTRKALGTYKQLLTIFASYDVFITLMHLSVKPYPQLLNLYFGKPPDIVEHEDFSSELFHRYCLCYYLLTGDREEIGKELLRSEYLVRYGREQREGWIIMNHWVLQCCPHYTICALFKENGAFNLRIFIAMCAYDAIMIVSFSIAVGLASGTFYYIRRADTISTQALNMQFKLFIAVCAQTVVPLVFVYIPYFFVVTFPFFHLPIWFFDHGCMFLTACFPAWDAVVIILLMKDYRDGLLGMCRKK